VEVKRLVNEHLTAAMVMVRLDEPLDPEVSAEQALAYLEENAFDMALLGTPEVRVIYAERLVQLGDRRRQEPVKKFSSSPRGDRLIEHTLELREVARRLRDERIPLIVVGRDGPEYLVTRADFTRSAGQAGLLLVLAALDAELDDLLRPHELEAWPQLSDEVRGRVEEHVARALKREEDLHRLAYLTMRERFELVRALQLSERLGIDLGTQAEHERATSVRNDIAHGREVTSGREAIEVLEIAERILDNVCRYLDEREADV
jgi:hypothetical protein